MKRLLLPLLSLLLVFSTSKACINEYGKDSDGEESEAHSSFDFHFHNNFNDEDIIESAFGQILVLRGIEKVDKYDPANPYHYLSNLGVKLLVLGETEKSLDIFLKLNEAFPNEYQIIANLGTTYELSGELDSALKYIKRGIELNEYSHYSSEWVHVKILEAKIAARSNPDWLKDNKILGIDFSKQPKLEKHSKEYEQLLDTAWQMLHQLDERCPFVKGKSPYVAQLFVDAGDIMFKQYDVLRALEFYQLAQEHANQSEYASSGNLSDKVEKCKSILEERKEEVEPHTLLHYNNQKSLDRYNELMEAVNSDYDQIVALGLRKSFDEPVKETKSANVEEETSKALYYSVGIGVIVVFIGFDVYRRRRKKT